MKPIIIACCLMISSFVYSQKYFDLYEHTSRYTRTQACEVIGNQVFYSKSHHSGFARGYDIEHWLIKADDELNRLDSVDLRNLLSLPAHKTLILVDMKEDKGDVELSLQSQDTSFYCGYFQSHILRFDTNLNLSDSNSLGTSNYSFIVANTFDLNNKRLAAGHSDECVNGNWGTSMQGIVDLALPNSYQLIDHIPNGNPIHLFDKVNDTMFVYSFRVYNVLSIWVILNENWEMEDNGPLVSQGSSSILGTPGQFLPYEYITKPNELPIPISIGYSHYNNDLHWNVVVGSIDTLNDRTVSDTLPIGGRSELGLDSNWLFNFQISQDMLDQRDLDSVFFAVGTGKMTQDSFANKVIQPMYFYNYNANNMSSNGTKKVVPNYPWDPNFAISSFSDGRILLGVNEYNWDKFGNNTMAIHWMVVPRDGSMLNQLSVSPDKSIAVYPNPTSDLIRIDEVPLDWKQIHYSLSDLTGRKVASGSLIQPDFTLHLNSLGIQPGSYLLQIENTKGERISPVKIIYNEK